MIEIIKRHILTIFNSITSRYLDDGGNWTTQPYLFPNEEEVKKALGYMERNIINISQNDNGWYVQREGNYLRTNGYWDGLCDYSDAYFETKEAAHAAVNLLPIFSENSELGWYAWRLNGEVYEYLKEDGEWDSTVPHHYFKTQKEAEVAFGRSEYITKVDIHHYNGHRITYEYISFGKENAESLGNYLEEQVSWQIGPIRKDGKVIGAVRAVHYNGVKS